MGKTATKPVVRLEDWSVVTFLGQYEAPELRVTCLHGLRPTSLGGSQS